MKNIEFDFTNLLPQFDVVLQGIFNTSSGLSSLIWIILTSIFLYFIVIVVIPSFIRSSRNVNFLFKILKGIDKNKLISQRQQILEDTEKSSVCGDLWQEFDESLVQTQDGKYLYNTIDSSHFFNTHTLARGMTESRLLAAVPGFLTAIGVIGTFIGLQLGLSEINLSSNNTETMKLGIAALIQAASVAFMTSVWGIAYSVMFNFFEKYLESKIRKKIARLQDIVDNIFPRKIAEQTLDEIAHHNKESNETLSGLAEKIGSRMQVAVEQMHESIITGMEESMRRVMNPAIEKLVSASSQLTDKQAEGSEVAVKQLLDKFMSGFGNEGDRQRELMNQASDRINDVVTDWGNEMTGFLSGLEEKQQKNEEFEEKRQVAFENTLEELEKKQTYLSSKISDVAKENIDATKDVVSQAQKLGEGISQTQESIVSLSDNMKSVSENLTLSADALENGYKQVADTNRTLATATNEATQANTSLAEQNKLTSQQLNNMIEEIRGLRDKYQSAAETLNDSSRNANEIFGSLKEHQEGYRDSLDKHVKSLNDQLSSMLDDYTRRVQAQTSDRLNAWDKETLKYTNSMQGIVNAMQELIDGIDARPQSIN